MIEELRTTHALQAPEQKIKKQEAEQIDKNKLQEKRLLHRVRLTITYSGIEHVSVATIAFDTIIVVQFIHYASTMPYNI